MTDEALIAQALGCTPDEASRHAHQLAEQRALDALYRDLSPAPSVDGLTIDPFLDLTSPDFNNRENPDAND